MTALLPCGGRSVQQSPMQFCSGSTLVAKRGAIISTDGVETHAPGTGAPAAAHRAVGR
jgi:hypothetical protein